ncbi:MAG TPA: PQQ-binding-like beta-propeller repeat protein [Steroidobacteraceae bacterium]|nr:PQQ-binding-like beta-propeller repeat protein [Steroidobacteraceae bacterium]
MSTLSVTMRLGPFMLISALLASLAAARPGFTDESLAEPIPAFSAAQLAAYPRDGWYTNGGNLANQRFSPLDLINRANVGGLKAVWRASLNGSGLNPRDGNQAQPIVYDGTIYLMTGDGDAFAVDLASGKVLWEFKANVDPRVARPCCAWPGRGVAIGAGKVFVGELDARLIALDQHSGRIVWSVQAEDPRKGYVIASAPLYYDGLVITGFAGSDMGTRGRIKAYDASTGALRWTFYTVPGPGEFGHDTWPKNSAVWKYGGAAIWQTPAVDPALGLIYFSTANPGPVLDGAVRAGDNLFSVSIVALDVKTGRYRWHFQQVHHDLWDYDSANPVILFDAIYDGKLRKGIAEAAKTGWVYILDRVTGKPLIGIVEKPVMQLAQQHTSPTQPFPVGDALVPQSIDIAPEGFDLVNGGRIFTPFAKHPAVWKPLAAVNWPPSSYDPRLHRMFICAQDSLWGAVGGDPNYPVVPGALYSGSVVQRFAAPRRGIFEALDVTTNRLVWRQQWVDTCYSGSVATAGGLVFVGRNDGRFTALDELTGRRLWSFQTDGGVNAPASVFAHDGKEYVAVLAGGTTLAGSKHSDGLWLFSLDGTLSSLPPGSADPGPRPRMGGPRGGAGALVPTGPLTPAELAQGKLIFTTTCVVCHGESGQGGSHGGAKLTHVLTSQGIVNVLERGRNDMPAFGSAFSAEQLHDVTGYVLELAAQH